MNVTFLGTTSNGGHCPTAYVTDRGTYIVQGEIVTDPDALNTIRSTYAGIGPNETLVEIPAALVTFFPANAASPSTE